MIRLDSQYQNPTIEPNINMTRVVSTNQMLRVNSQHQIYDARSAARTESRNEMTGPQNQMIRLSKGQESDTGQVDHGSRVNSNKRRSSLFMEDEIAASNPQDQWISMASRDQRALMNRREDQDQMVQVDPQGQMTRTYPDDRIIKDRVGQQEKKARTEVESQGWFSHQHQEIPQDQLLQVGTNQQQLIRIGSSDHLRRVGPNNFMASVEPQDQLMRVVPQSWRDEFGNQIYTVGPNDNLVRVNPQNHMTGMNPESRLLEVVPHGQGGRLVPRELLFRVGSSDQLTRVGPHMIRDGDLNQMEMIVPSGPAVRLAPRDHGFQVGPMDQLVRIDPKNRINRLSQEDQMANVGHRDQTTREDQPSRQTPKDNNRPNAQNVEFINKIEEARKAENQIIRLVGVSKKQMAKVKQLKKKALEGARLGNEEQTARKSSEHQLPTVMPQNKTVWLGTPNQGTKVTPDITLTRIESVNQMANINSQSQTVVSQSQPVRDRVVSILQDDVDPRRAGVSPQLPNIGPRDQKTKKKTPGLLTMEFGNQELDNQGKK